MRDIFVSMIIVGLMPTCYRRPFVGLVIFSWLAYMRVQDLTWGFAKYQRWSYFVAILTAVGFVVSKERKRWFLPDPRCYIMIFLALWIAVGVALSVSPSKYQFTRLLEFFKVIAIALFTTSVVSTKERLRVMLWVIALSFGFYGVKSGLWGIATFGAPILAGPGGMIADNNDFALAIAMSVPMLFYLGWTERRPELKRAFFVALPLSIITVVCTHSRGGFLALSCGIAVMVWRSRNRFLGIGIAVALGIAGVLLAPPKYIERLKTIKDYQTEGSAAGRIRAWGIATRMATDNPFFGVGLNKFRWHYLTYNPNPLKKEIEGSAIIVAHSSYFQIWAECGTPALLIFFLLMFSSLWTCWRIRKEATRRYMTSWIINYATMFEASMVTFMVGTSFLNRAHFDLFYHWVALIVVFGHLADMEMKNPVRYPLRENQQRSELRRQRRTGFERRDRRVSAFVPRGA